MFAVTKSIKFQNKLAKEAILNALKSKSKIMFSEGMILRCFMNVTKTRLRYFTFLKIESLLIKQDHRGLINFGKIFERWVKQFQV